MQERRFAAVFLIMRELGGFTINSLEDRVLMQKAVYLFQLFDLDLRFRFSWYLRGPYSRELAYCAREFDDKKTPGDVTKKLKLNERAKRAATQLKGWLETRPQELEKSRWLELISSIHYLLHIASPTSAITIDKVGEHLKRVGKDEFTQEQVAQAWKALEECGGINNKLLSHSTSGNGDGRTEIR